jgi:hypothetical protein
MGTMTREEFIEEFGATPEQVAREMEEFRASTAYFAQHEAELRQAHSDEWIAIHEGKLVVSATTHDELLGELKAKGIASNHSLIRYLPSDEPTLILSWR